MIELRKTRIEKGLTQSQIAKAIGVSRPKYLKIEDTGKGITLEQADILRKEFGIDLLAPVQANKDTIEKFRDTILAVIKFAGSYDGRITKTKLAKIIYLCDAQWYKEHDGQLITSMVYRRLPQGPVPYEFFQSIDQMVEDGTLNIKLKGLAQLIGANESFVSSSSLLSAEELGLIKKISSKWKNKRTDAIVSFTHKHPTWLKAADYEPINMSLLKDIKEPIY